jgi:MoxR-like ATPase
LSDIRSFLAGCSASYLTILQGISGTGKTSLPKAFARAVGGGCNVIEVQAGWRERADLIGHYNSFEGKFYEQKFLRALYRAQCPAYEDRLFLVVLDEMNLSYVEQYFADLLSVMERPESEHRLELMTEPLTDRSVPRLLYKGRSLRIPPNVRFIGTANQDETTKDIADKTYGRAHILELPIEHPRFVPDAQNAPPPRVSYRSLEEAFDAARRKHRKDAEASYEFLQGRPRNVLMQRFGVGWGNRLEKQVRTYVPVILAAGGSIGEATDYVLALKILRKTRDRYEYQKEDFEILKETLEDAWLDLEDEAWKKPKKSLRVIEAELRRK